MRAIAVVLLCIICANLEAQEPDSAQDLIEDSSETSINYEFPTYEDKDFLNSLIARFSLHNENYFLPAYYSISSIRAPYKNIETKFQFSFKANVFSDIFWGIGLYFAYTQTSFFQIYSQSISAPFRDNDYMPEIMLYRALDWDLWGGKFYNLRVGYRHLSNGVGEGDNTDVSRSRGVDRLLAEIMYKNGDFNATFTLTLAYLIADKNNRIRSYMHYMGWGDLNMSYRFLERNTIALTLKNLFHNYGKYKGSVMLEYKFDLNLFSIYMQYFYGYGDNIHQYNIKSHNIGIGVAISRF